MKPVAQLCAKADLWFGGTTALLGFDLQRVPVTLPTLLPQIMAGDYQALQ